MKLLSIGDVASQVGIRPSTLRAWDKLGLLLSRGRDILGNRTYTDSDVAAAKAVLQQRLARRGFGRRLTGNEAA